MCCALLCRPLSVDVCDVIISDRVSVPCTCSSVSYTVTVPLLPPPNLNLPYPPFTVFYDQH